MNDINDVIDAEVVDAAVPETPPVEVPQPTLRDLLTPVRGANEAYDEYCNRRKSAKRAVKQYLSRGTLVHNSLPDPNKKGVTYRKPKEQ